MDMLPTTDTSQRRPDERPALRAVVVGPGTIGRVHVDALRRNGVEVASVVASTAERAQAAARRLRIPHADASLAAALARGVDAVHVCAPNTWHRGLALTALEAGAHVVCEKPLAASAAHAAELADAARQAGVVHAVCFNNRFYPLVQEIAARRRAGALGRVFLVRASVADDTLWHRGDWDWRLDPAVGGPTVVTSTTGSHLVDLVSFLLGARPVEVCASFGLAHAARRPSGARADVPMPARGSDGDDLAGLLVRFDSGAQAVLSMSHVSAGHPYRIRVEIDAEAQGVSWDSERPNDLWIGHRDAPNELLTADPRHMRPEARRFIERPGAYREGFDETFRLLFREVYAQVRGQTAPPPAYPDFHDGRAQLAVHEAVRLSAAERRWAAVDWSSRPEPPPP